MNTIFESTIEEFVIGLLANQGFEYLSPEKQELERHNLSDVLLRERLKRAVDILNPSIPEDAKTQAIRELFNFSSQNLVENNEKLHKLLTEGIEIEVRGTDGIKGDKVKLIDFENIENNEFIVCNQYTVIENNINKRPDVVLLINGIPLVVIELKNPVDENATVQVKIKVLMLIM
jgi:type I restriction enzyme R subunit